MMIHGEVKELYPGLTADQTKTTYNTDLQISLDVYKSTFDSVIRLEKKRLKLQGKSGLELSTKEAEALRTAIKQDFTWRVVLAELVKEFYPNASPKTDEEFEHLKSAITIPWWNGQNSRMEKCTYNNSLDVKLSPSHSYLTQMVRKKLISGEDYDNPSVGGLTISNDGWIMLGLRGGHFKSGSIMITPAGSIGMESLFDAYHRELEEELYLKPEHMEDVRLIGRVFDNTIVYNSLFVFDGRVNLSAEEIKKHWKDASDKREHVDLIPVKAEPEELSDYLVNTKNILVPCTLSLMAYGKTNFGEKWFEETQKMLAQKDVHVV